MFGLMRRAKHEDVVLGMQCDLQYQQQRNEILQERIRRGEDYRARLERERDSLKGKNRELVHKLDSAQAALDEERSQVEKLRMMIREQQLLIGSFEANWAARNEREESA